MHLNNEQLLELDDTAKLHLISCSDCRKKVKNIANLRMGLTKLPVLKMPTNNWQQTKQAYLLQLKEQQAEKSKREMKIWRAGALSMAASLLIVVLWGMPKLSVNSHMPLTKETQLSQLIAHNQLLQQEFSQRATASLDNVYLVQLNDELSKIDKALQQAYAESVGNKEKEQLWQQRHKIIGQMLLATEQQKTITI